MSCPCWSAGRNNNALTHDCALERLRAALTDLLVWAEWIRERRGTPKMNEPNTGAIDLAIAALADSPAAPERSEP